MAPLLICQSISKSFGTRSLFTSLDFTIEEGDRIGVLGPNGSGKSTLLKIIAGLEEADKGQVTRNRLLRLAYMAQEDNFDPTLTVEQTVTHSRNCLSRNTSELDHLGDFENSIVITSKTISNLGFKDRNQLVQNLSGGWRKRLALACALAREPNLLIMDEPTNHLDLEGILWLEQYLKQSTMAVAIVSHDRAFLENATNRTLEINRCFPAGHLVVSGNYSEFLEKRESALDSMRREEEGLSNRVRREIEWLRRGPKARTSKADARIQEAHRLIDNLAETRGRLQSASAAQIEFTASGRKTKRLIAVDRISKKLGDKQLLSDLSFVLSPGVRLGLLGENGSGKTTLLNMLADTISPDAGLIERAPDLRIVLFDQNRAQLLPEVSLSRMLAPDSDSVIFQGRALHIAAYANRFGFDHKALNTPVTSLSGGEKARLLIAHLMLQKADILLLDEPTNDLDLDSIRALEESLEIFPGAVVLVTHDRMMLDRISNVIVGLHNDGTSSIYADHSQWLKEHRQKNASAQNTRPTSNSLKPLTHQPKISQANLTKSRKELAKIETLIEKAERDLEATRKSVEDPSIASNPEALVTACTELANAQRKVDDLYSRWDELESICNELK